jgi:hypothetical protein
MDPSLPRTAFVTLAAMTAVTTVPAAATPTAKHEEKE